MLERNQAGECVFFERESRLCVVHRDLGRRGAARHVPPLPARGGARPPRHVREPVALLPDGGGDAVPRRREPDDRRRRRRRFRRPTTKACQSAADDLPPLLRPGRGDGSRGLLRVGGAHGAPVRRGAGAGIGAGDARARRRPSCAAGRRAGRRWPISSTRCRASFGRGRASGDACGKPRAYARTMAAVPDDLRPSPDEDASRGGLQSAGGAGVGARGRAPLRRYSPPRRSRRGRRIRAAVLRRIVRGLRWRWRWCASRPRARAATRTGRSIDELLLEAFRHGRLHPEPPGGRRGPGGGVVQGGRLVSRWSLGRSSDAVRKQRRLEPEAWRLEPTRTPRPPARDRSCRTRAARGTTRRVVDNGALAST